MKKLFTGLFNPGSNGLAANCGFLVLRVWLGTSILLLHGWGKFTDFHKMAGVWMNFLGMGSQVSLALTIFAELVCSGLLVLGLVTRFAALVLVIDLSVAFTMAHHGKLIGPHSGELAFVYLAGFATLFLAGPGRFSVDARVFGKGSR